jgi:hypothetical protein
VHETRVVCGVQRGAHGAQGDAGRCALAN